MSELPNGWASVEMRELASIKLGKMLDKTKNKGDPHPYLRNINVRWGEFDLSDLYCMRFTEDELPIFEIRDGDLIVCEGGEPGRCAVWRNGPTQLKYQKALLRARFADGVNPSLVALYMRLLANSGQLQDHFTGTTIKHLPHTAFEKIKVPLPPQKEQCRIVAKLDSLHSRSARARQELDHIPTLIERYKQAILAKAFSGELTKEWRDRNDVDAGETVSLESVADDFSYGSSAKSSPAGRVPVLRMSNIQDGKLDWTDLVFTSDADEIEKYRLQAGDVLFNRTNSPELVGKTALYSGDREAIYAGYLIRIRCSERLLPAYLTYALNSPQGRHYCWQVKTDGVSQSNVNAKKLAAFQLLLPRLEEQREVVRRIDHAVSWLDKIATEHVRAEHLLPKLDQAILAKAFRGELAPQDPHDEPASMLLERIKAEREGADVTTVGRHGRRQKN